MNKEKQLVTGVSDRLFDAYKRCPPLLNKIKQEFLDELKKRTKSSYYENENIEYGGAIYKINDKLHIKITRGDARKTEIPKCKGKKIIAEFHTHTNGVSLFSREDMIQAYESKKPQLLGAYQVYYEEHIMGYADSVLKLGCPIKSVYNFLWFNPVTQKCFRMDIEEKQKNQFLFPQHWGNQGFLRKH